MHNDHHSKEILREWLRVRHWLYAVAFSSPHSDERDSIVQRYETLFSTPIEPLDATAVRRYAKSLRARLRQTVRTLQETKAQKIDFTDVARRKFLGQPLVWLLTTTFTFSGYFYATTYFAHFNVDTSMYFTVPDYIAYSIDKVLLAVMVPLGYLAGALQRYVRHPTLPRQAHERYMRGPGLMILISLSLAVLISPVIAIYQPSRFYLLYLPIMSFPLLYYIEHHAVPKYFFNLGNSSTFIAALIFFFIVTWGSAMSHVHQVRDSTPLPFVIHTMERRYDESAHRILGGNSGYVFLLESNEHVVILPKHSIRNISIETQRTLGARSREWLKSMLRSGYTVQPHDDEDGQGTK